MALLVCVLGAVVNPSPAYACSCARSSLRRDLDRSDVVFFGSVQAAETVQRPRPKHVEVTFEVSRVYKGSAYRQQVVTTPAEGECGLNAAPGAQLVVFATQQIQGERGTAGLITSLCNGNLPTSSPPSLLGNGYAPLTGSSQDVDRAVRVDESLTKALTVGGIILAGVVAVGVIGVALLWRRRPTA